MQNLFGLMALFSIAWGVMFSILWRSPSGYFMSAPGIVVAIAIVALWARPLRAEPVRSALHLAILIAWLCLSTFALRFV